MGDHFALMRDRLITEATLQVVIESINSAESTCGIHVEPSVMEKGGEPNCDERMVQCRICHDEDLVHQMDAPCSCTGSLKYVHPRCVLRWCQEKGNNTCEICLKQFRGYILHRRIVLHMSDSITRRNNEMQQRNVSRGGIPRESSSEGDPANNRSWQSVYEKLTLSFLLTVLLVPQKFFVGALVILLVIFFVAAPALQCLYHKLETNDSARMASNV